ncbi:MAG: DEAD/DEAH box helicase [Candidatus Sericytochromatia bacterium]
MKFEELNISEEMLQAINDMGFEEATPIQSEAIPVILEGNDIIGQAQTGTGKTIAFGLPAIENLDLDSKKVQILILCPTRELSIQVSEELSKLCKYKKGVNIATIYGGQSYDKQFQALKKNPKIVVGTPGRVIDHLEKNKLNLEDVKMFVLDEADEMLNMGFLDDIEKILETVPDERQTIFFSATMPKQILELTKKYQKNPKTVKITHKELTVPTIEQYYYEIKAPAKFEVLTRLIDFHNIQFGLVFCNTKQMVDDLAVRLQEHGYPTESLHGDMKQAQREQVMKRFKSGNVQFLVATDVAARGIDIDDIEAVFNFDIPYDEENYVHRIGRTGRAGKKGISFTFVVGKEAYKIRDIQRYANAKLTLKRVPSFEEVEQIRIDKYLVKVKEVINENKKALDKYIKIVETMQTEGFSPVDTSAALLKMNMGLSDKKYEDSASIEKEKLKADHPLSGKMSRLFINLGKKDKIAPKDILGSIAGETGLDGRSIGEIDIYPAFSFVEVPAEFASKVIEIMNKNKIKGNPVTFELSDGKGKRDDKPSKRGKKSSFDDDDDSYFAKRDRKSSGRANKSRFSDDSESKSFDDKPARRERKPRFDDDSERKSFDDKPARRERKPRFENDSESKSFDDKPARRERKPRFGDDSERKSFDDKPARRERKDKFSEFSFGESKPRRKKDEDISSFSAKEKKARVEKEVNDLSYLSKKIKEKMKKK